MKLKYQLKTLPCIWLLLLETYFRINYSYIGECPCKFLPKIFLPLLSTLYESFFQFSHQVYSLTFFHYL